MRWISETFFNLHKVIDGTDHHLINLVLVLLLRFVFRVELNELHERNGKRGNYQRVPDDIRKALAFHAYKYGVNAAVNWGNKTYQKF